MKVRISPKDVSHLTEEEVLAEAKKGLTFEQFAAEYHTDRKQMVFKLRSLFGYEAANNLIAQFKKAKPSNEMSALLITATVRVETKPKVERGDKSASKTKSEAKTETDLNLCIGAAYSDFLKKYCGKTVEWSKELSEILKVFCLRYLDDMQPEIDDIMANYEAFNNDLSVMRREYDEKKSIASDAQVNCSSLAMKKSELEDRIDRAEKKISWYLPKQISEAKSKANDVRNEIERRSGKTRAQLEQKLAGMESKIQELERSVTEAESKLERLKQELAEVLNQIEKQKHVRQEALDDAAEIASFIKGLEEKLEETKCAKFFISKYDDWTVLAYWDIYKQEKISDMFEGYCFSESDKEVLADLLSNLFLYLFDKSISLSVSEAITITKILFFCNLRNIDYFDIICDKNTDSDLSTLRKVIGSFF